MTRFMVVDGDDVASLLRLDSLSLSAAAYGCDVGQGGFDWDDDVLADLPAMKGAYLEETASSPIRAWRGFVGLRAIDRGVRGKVENQRQLDVELLDVNTLWDDPVLEGTDSNRPAETDVARMSWLAATTEMTSLGISVGVMPNTNTVNLDARDYRGEHPRLVAEECMEAASKNCFLYDYGSGIKLYYDLATGTSLSSSAQLSTVLADVDGSTVFAMSVPTLRKDPVRIYSRVRFEYAGGHVTVDNATTESSFRFRAVTIRDDTVKSSAVATSKANKYLARSASEQRIFVTSVNLPAANLNDVREGQRIEVKCPHLEIDDWTWMRISRRTLLPQQGAGGSVWDRYTLALEFAEDLKPAGFGGRSGPGGDTAAVDDGGAVALVRYQLEQETGGGPFGPAAGLWSSIAPNLDLSDLTSLADSIVSRSPEDNIAWPYTDCGVGTGGVAGLMSRSAWYRFTADLSDETLVGIRVSVGAFLSLGSGYTTSPGGFLVGDDTVICGVHTGADADGVEVTDQDDYVELARIGSGGGEVVIPRSLLIDVGDGFCWFVLAPAWVISNNLLICNSAGNKPWGYGSAGDDGTTVVSAVEVHASGSGTSPWLPAVGDVDGSNDEFELPLWNGEGVPELRVGLAVLGAGEFTYDGDASPPTATLLDPPPALMAGQVSYRGAMG